MRQNLINLIISYLFLISLISCGSSDGDFMPDKGTGSNKDDNQTIIQKSGVIFTSAGKVSVLENQLNAITLKATSDTAITYSISEGDSSSFSINSSSGVVVFKTKPNYETKTSYTFKAKAKNSHNKEDTQNIIILILDEDEKPPVFTSPNAVQVKENTIIALTVKTQDDSIVTYSMGKDEESSKFNINATSGEITFRKAPDYESKTSYSLVVIAKDAKDNNSTQNISITILDIKDETKPVWTSSKTASVYENQLNAITLTVTDDSSTITYSIIIEDALPGTNNSEQIDEDDSDAFDVSRISGKVTFKKKPDYENKSSYSFRARATDSEGNQATQYIIITILNVDDTPPKFTSLNNLSLKENTRHTIILKATDESPLTYSISGGDSDSFNINATSGKVIFKNAPDYESKSSYSFKATAKDTKGYTSTQDINIKILDIFDEIKPKWISSDIAYVKEGDFNVTILKATDKHSITYSIGGADGDKLNVDNNTGLVTFKEKPNFQLKPVYKFTAYATDKYENVAEQNRTINIIFVEDILKTFTGHVGDIHSLAISPDGKYFLSGSGDNTLKLWDMNTRKLEKTFTHHTNDILSIAITLDGKYILVGSGDKSIKLLDINTSSLMNTFTGHKDKVHSIALTPDGKYFLSTGGYQDKTIKLWNIRDDHLEKTFIGHTGGVHSIAISADGKYIASGSNDESIKLWDIHTNTDSLIKTFERNTSIVDAVQITLDGKYILSGSSNKHINLWDINTGDLIRVFRGHTDIIRVIALTPDGKYFLSGSGDNTIKLWDIMTGTLIRTFKGHLRDVSSIVVTPDGKYVVSGSWDNTIKLWDLDIINP